jgi:hypothetical protein
MEVGREVIGSVSVWYLCSTAMTALCISSFSLVGSLEPPMLKLISNMQGQSKTRDGLTVMILPAVRSVWFRLILDLPRQVRSHGNVKLTSGSEFLRTVTDSISLPCTVMPQVWWQVWTF